MCTTSPHTDNTTTQRPTTVMTTMTTTTMMMMLLLPRRRREQINTCSHSQQPHKTVRAVQTHTRNESSYARRTRRRRFACLLGSKIGWWGVLSASSASAPRSRVRAPHRYKHSHCGRSSNGVPRVRVFPFFVWLRGCIDIFVYD